MTTNRGMYALLTQPDQEIGWYSGCTFRGITFKKNGRSWLAVVKVTDRQERDKVAFVSSTSYMGCWELIYAALHTTGVTLNWKDDKFARK